MTLSTFHHAGREKMNVTLGIPRLQEIIMTASSIIRAPTMTCPLRRDKFSDDAERLAASMRKICVADLVENIEVCAVPLTIENTDVYTLCKLSVKLYGPISVWSKEKSPSPANSTLTAHAGQRKPSSRKKDNRAIYLECDGQNFKAHFRFLITDPLVMLKQIAEKTAKKVSIKNPGENEQCKVFDIDLDNCRNIPMLREGKELSKALQTTGVNFQAFWDLQDDLDINFISSNSMDPILSTYGIEAARATMITEIYRVFNHYGVSVDMRHLMLVADFMTHTGEYRAMNRTGGVAESTSLFSRLCFETASKFIVEAATHS